MFRSLLTCSHAAERSHNYRLLAMAAASTGITQQLKHIVQLEKRKEEATDFQKDALKLDAETRKMSNTASIVQRGLTNASAGLRDLSSSNDQVNSLMTAVRKVSAQNIEQRQAALHHLPTSLAQLASVERRLAQLLMRAATSHDSEMWITSTSKPEKSSSFAEDGQLEDVWARPLVASASACLQPGSLHSSVAKAIAAAEQHENVAAKIHSDAVMRQAIASDEDAASHSSSSSDSDSSDSDDDESAEITSLIGSGPGSKGLSPSSGPGSSKDSSSPDEMAASVAEVLSTMRPGLTLRRGGISSPSKVELESKPWFSVEPTLD